MAGAALRREAILEGEGAMADETHGGALGAVYGATTPEEVAGHYDRWAETYEADMASVGYRHPAICLGLVARHVPRGAAPLLDAGCGTGLLGEWMQLLGYPEIEGLDVSDGMLRVAADKRTYSRLHKLALGGRLPFATGRFGGIVSVGVFTSGHVGAEGLDELVRVCSPGGAIVLTVKTTLMLDGFEARLAQLEAEGRIERVETTAPYVSMPGEAATVPSVALVLRVVRPA